MSEKRRYLVEQLLKTTNEWDAYATAVRATLQVLYLRYHIPDDEFKDIRDTLGFEHYVKSIIDIYVKYLSDDDLQEILDFYNSPVGKRMANEKMLFEIARFSKQWADKVNTLCKNANKPVSPPSAESGN